MTETERLWSAWTRSAVQAASIIMPLNEDQARMQRLIVASLNAMSPPAELVRADEERAVNLAALERLERLKAEHATAKPDDVPFEREDWYP